MNGPQSDANLLIVADKYNVTGLKSMCLRYLQENLNVNNVLEITVTAYLLDNTKLLQMSSNFLVDNLGLIQKCEYWDQIQKKHPNIALKVMDMIIFGKKTNKTE